MTKFCGFWRTPTKAANSSYVHLELNGIFSQLASNILQYYRPKNRISFISPRCRTCFSRSSANRLSTCDIPLLYFLKTDSSSSSPSPTANAAICARISRSSVSSPGCCEVSKHSGHISVCEEDHSWSFFNIFQFYPSSFHVGLLLHFWCFSTWENCEFASSFYLIVTYLHIKKQENWPWSCQSFDRFSWLHIHTEILETSGTSFTSTSENATWTLRKFHCNASNNCKTRTQTNCPNKKENPIFFIKPNTHSNPAGNCFLPVECVTQVHMSRQILL